MDISFRLPDGKEIPLKGFVMKPTIIEPNNFAFLGNLDIRLCTGKIVSVPITSEQARDLWEAHGAVKEINND